ncbi:MAG: glycoside hydrolase family 3 protein [Lachnospiraceae bacterium]|nr:glycoside hydrolase family 3 protein [Lachnospiraceae bacterium]
MSKIMKEKGLGPFMAKMLSIALVITTFAGCEGSGAEQDTMSGTSTESSVTESESTETSSAQDNTKESSPMVEEKKDIVEELMNQMTLEEKVGQMMIASFRSWQELSSTEPNAGTTVENPEIVETPQIIYFTELSDTVRECIKKYHFGGTILFAENIKDTEQTLRYVLDMQSTNQQGGGIPYFVAIDQEGGNVTRINYATMGVGNMALAATGKPENAMKMAQIYGTELQALGINVNYAPVLDINSDATNPVIGVRSFSDSPEVVQRFGVAYQEGLRSTGTIATLKHFPGHGDTDTDSHTGFPCINKTYEELKAFELVPFAAAIENGAEMIMTAHIQYPEIEKETYVSTSTGEEVYLPATMSQVILTDILRGELGFEGVIVTDALEMAAIADNFAMEDVLCKTISAGADMLMLPMVYDSLDFDALNECMDLAISLVKEGKIDEKRIDESVRRILKLKEKYGLLEETDFSVTQEKIDKAVETIGSKGSRDEAWDIAMQALTLVKNDGPLTSSRF